MAITADGTAYDLFGPQHAPAVVLIHELGMTRATWDDIVPVLARNFRVVTMIYLAMATAGYPVQPQA